MSGRAVIYVALYLAGLIYSWWVFAREEGLARHAVMVLAVLWPVSMLYVGIAVVFGWEIPVWMRRERRGSRTDGRDFR